MHIIECRNAYQKYALHCFKQCNAYFMSLAKAFQKIYFLESFSEGQNA